MIKSDVSDCVNVNLLCWGFSDGIITLRDDGGAGAHRGMMELQYAVCISFLPVVLARSVQC